MPPGKTCGASSPPKCDLAPALPVEPERVEQTVRWLLTGAREADVVEAIRTTWPDQELQPLIAAAVEQLARSGQPDPQVIRGWCLEAARELYRRMSEIGDFAGAIRAVKLVRDLAA